MSRLQSDHYKENDLISLAWKLKRSVSLMSWPGNVKEKSEKIEQD